MKLNLGASYEQDNISARSSSTRPEYRVEYRINLTLSVSDPQALWTAAAARLLAAPDMTLDDVLDVLGPREDPSINDCIAMLAKPVAMAGCVMDDFWIDRARDCRPPKAVPSSAIEFKLPSADQGFRRVPPARRGGAQIALCGSHIDSPENTPN